MKKGQYSDEIIYTTQQACATQTYSKQIIGAKVYTAGFFSSCIPTNSTDSHHVPHSYLLLMAPRILHHLHSTAWAAQEFDPYYKYVTQ